MTAEENQILTWCLVPCNQVIVFINISSTPIAGSVSKTLEQMYNKYSRHVLSETGAKSLYFYLLW